MNEREQIISVCLVHDLGTVDYENAWQLQEKIAGQVAHGISQPTLLLLEHPHTYTFGRRGQIEHLLWDESEQRRRGVKVLWVDRGGDITYHGPGQLVGYPILPLGSSIQDGRQAQVDYVGYVRRLEQTLILALLRLGLPSGQIPGLTGVWVQPDVVSRCLRCTPEMRKSPSKVASIGVKVDARGISRHGFALNVNPDMAYWNGIVACGIKDASMISLVDLMPTAPSMEEVKHRVISAFGETFGYKMNIQKLEIV
jgi:lipoyl(octanoyl) transferase